MKLIIIANFPSDLDGGLQGRFINIAMLMHERGHNVEVIVSDFQHAKKQHRKVMDNKYPFLLTYLHEPGYPNNVSPQRLWSHFIWGKNVLKYIKESKDKPDVIYAALPTFTAGRLVGKWCNGNGVKYVIDVQDIWPEAFNVVVKNPILRLLFIPMKWISNAAYKSADYVIGCSDTYRNRALKVNNRCKHSLTVFLGNNGQKFDKGRNDYNVPKTSDEFRIAYIGTMGYSYDLKLAIDAIKMAEKQKLNKKIKFIAIGDGPLLNEYTAHAKKTGIEYVFTGALEYEKMVGLMCSCDAVINCLRPGAAQSITNKVGDYALSGLPVINTQENTEYREMVEKWRCGINCECGNVSEVSKAIIKLINNPMLCKEMGQNARKLGLERFDRRTSYLNIVDLLENIM